MARVWGVGSLRNQIIGTNDAFDNIIDVSEIPLHATVIENVDGATREDGFREQPDRHVRTSPGTIDGEESQSCGGQAEEMAVRVSHQFVGLFGCRIQADGMVDAIFHRKRGFSVGTVDGAGGCVGEVCNAVVSAGFEDIDKAGQIGVCVGVRIGQRVADSGLSRQMDDGVELLLLKQLLHPVAIFQCQLLK